MTDPASTDPASTDPGAMDPLRDLEDVRDAMAPHANELRTGAAFSRDAHETQASHGLENARFATAPHEPPRAAAPVNTLPDARVVLGVTLPPEPSVRAVVSPPHTVEMVGVPFEQELGREVERQQRRLPTEPRLAEGALAPGSAPAMGSASAMLASSSSAPSKRAMPIVLAALVLLVGVTLFAMYVSRGETVPGNGQTPSGSAASAAISTGQPVGAGSAVTMATTVGVTPVSAAPSGPSAAVSSVYVHDARSGAPSARPLPSHVASGPATAATPAYSSEFSNFHQETIK